MAPLLHVFSLSLFPPAYCPPIYVCPPIYGAYCQQPDLLWHPPMWGILKSF